MRQQSNRHEMLWARASHSTQRDAPVQRHEPPAVLDRQSQQINVRDLFVTEQARVVDGAGIEKRKIVGPELVQRPGCRCLESAHRLQ